MENNNGFTLKDVIFNLLFIILFVFILMWLFPSKSFLNNKGIYNSDEAQGNHIFNQNIETMKEAAISYFTTSRLPKNVGDSVTMTLRQMRDKKLLLSLIDSNNNVCDEGISYIEMTKEKDEYLLKVTLSCSDYDDYILVHLGCYDYCDGDVCEKQEEEILYNYQYKLETPCKWTDWSSWSGWSTNYITANANRKVETKIETETVNAITNKYCPSGYTYNSQTDKCYKTNSSTDVKDAEKTTTYNCDEYPGYTLDGDKCVMTITNSTIDSKEATPVYDYSCSKGTLSADKTTCSYSYTYTRTVSATCNSYQSCTTSSVFNPDTGMFEDKRTCVTKCNYSCPSGYTRSGTTCTGKATANKTIDSEKFISTYSCQTGYTLDGNYCKKEVITETVDTKEATVVENYNCNIYSGYTINGTKCEKIVEGTETVDVKINTTCPSGYTMNNNKCTRNIIKYRYSEKKCVGGSVDYKWSDSEKDQTLLDKGYVLTGVKEQKNSK